MITALKIPSLVIALLLLSVLPAAGSDGFDFHEDYYRGFAHGAYYGLMLAGVDYHVAWCMKAELEYEAASMGTGADFQQKLESLLAACTDGNDPD